MTHQKIKRLLGIGFSLLMFYQISFSQADQRFKAGLIFGLNAAQIRGDDTGGYNKVGIVGGLRGITILTEKIDLSLELTYSQRGSRSSNEEQLRGEDVEINLQYIEVPFLVSYKDWLVEDKNYYKVQLSTGFSFSRLLDATAEGATNEHAIELDNFSDNDFSFVIGAEFFATEHISIAARWNTSFNRLYNQEENNPNINGLRGYFLSFRVNYIF